MTEHMHDDDGTVEGCPGCFSGFPDLQQIAKDLDEALRANRANGITDENELIGQALCVAEEAGELVGAYRRWAGLARRTGTKEDLEHEVADTLIVIAMFAHRARIDIAQALQDKLKIIYSRGWSEDATSQQQ